VLAGPVTCPTCDPLPANAERDVERIAARLDYAPSTEASASNEAPAKPSVDTVKAESGAPAEVAMIEPEKSAAPDATAALAAAPATSPATATAPEATEAKAEPAPEVKATTVEPAAEATAASEPAIAPATAEPEPKAAIETPQKLEEIP